MTLQVEERLLLKLLQFFGYVQQEDDLTSNTEEEDVCLYDAQRYTHFYVEESFSLPLPLPLPLQLKGK